MRTPAEPLRDVGGAIAAIHGVLEIGDLAVCMARPHGDGSNRIPSLQPMTSVIDAADNSN